LQPPFGRAAPPKVWEVSGWPQYDFSWFDEAAPAPGAALAHDPTLWGARRVFERA
jgi:hypothetical protein